MAEKVLEIGVGSFPWLPQPTMLRDYRSGEDRGDFREDSLYIGIDMPRMPSRRWIRRLVGEEPQPEPDETERNLAVGGLATAQALFSEARPAEHITFAAADAHHLPFRDDSFTKVYAANVFGSQLRGESLVAILSNIHRVLLPTGRLVIKETYTTEWADRGYLEKLLDSQGFSAQETIRPYMPAYQDYLHTYSDSLIDIKEQAADVFYQDDNFFCVARPYLK